MICHQSRCAESNGGDAGREREGGREREREREMQGVSNSLTAGIESTNKVVSYLLVMLKQHRASPSCTNVFSL